MSVRESITVLRGHLAQAREVLEDVDSGIRQPLIARDLDDFDRFLVRLARDG
jgi:hypothetical protein